MRITHQMMTSRLIMDLNQSTSKIAAAQRQVASGNRINKPSDDPLGAHDALRYREELAGIDQYASNVSEATDWVSTTDTALGEITDIVHRARELTVQGANGSVNANNRAAIAAEIDKLIDAVKDAANAKVGDAYVFSGSQTLTPPYTSGASDAYAGDTGVIARSIGPGVSVQVNTPGTSVIGAGGGDGKLLDTLRNIKAHLTGGTPANLNALNTTDLAALETNLDTISAARAVVGAAQNRIDTAETRLADAKEATTNLLGNTESADMGLALAQLTAQQTAYQAAMRTGATLIQTSLMDFLR
jgi:flagellar hook-associated protein 3 FlgL